MMTIESQGLHTNDHIAQPAASQNGWDASSLQRGTNANDVGNRTDANSQHIPPFRVVGDSEQKGNTTITKDDSGKPKEYSNNNYTLSKHDSDGKWYFNQEGSKTFVPVDADSIKMDDHGKVTYNESGLFGENNQTLGNGSTGFIPSITKGASRVEHAVVDHPLDTFNKIAILPATASDAVFGTHAIKAIGEMEKGAANEVIHHPLEIAKDVAIGGLIAGATVATGGLLGVGLGVGLGAGYLAGSELVKNKGDLGGVGKDFKDFGSTVKGWGNDLVTVAKPGQLSAEQQKAATQGLQQLGAFGVETAAGIAGGVAGAGAVSIARSAFQSARAVVPPTLESTIPAAGAQLDRAIVPPTPETTIPAAGPQLDQPAVSEIPAPAANDSVPNKSLAERMQSLNVRARDGVEGGRAWQRLYDGQDSVFPANELDQASELAPGTTASKPVDDELFRRELTGDHGRVNGWMIGQHLGSVGEDGPDMVANWYTAIDPKLQGKGLGGVVADDAYSQVFKGNPNAAIIAEVEHTSIDTKALNQFPSTAELRAAAGDGRVTELPPELPKDPDVVVTGEAGPNAGNMTALGQRLKRVAYWGGDRQIVPEADGTASGAEQTITPSLIKRTWKMPDLQNPGDPAGDAGAHLFVWSKDGQPLTRQEAYDSMVRMYKQGYSLDSDDRLLNELADDYANRPELFDSIPVANNAVPKSKP